VITVVASAIADITMTVPRLSGRGETLPSREERERLMKENM